MKTILCFGDSNTWGYVSETGMRFPADKRWCGVLRAKLGNGYEVIEEGLNGRTTVFDDPDSPYRSAETYLPPCLESHAPIDAVIIMLGTNDMKYKFGLEPEHVAKGMEKLINIIKNSCAGPWGKAPNVLLICPPHIAPVTNFDDFLNSHEKSVKLYSSYRVLAQKYGCTFLDASEIIHVSDLPDGIHLNETAHTALGEKAAELVKAVF